MISHALARWYPTRNEKGEGGQAKGIVITDLFYLRRRYRHVVLQLKCLHCPVEKGEPVAEIESFSF